MSTFIDRYWAVILILVALFLLIIVFLVILNEIRARTPTKITKYEKLYKIIALGRNGVGKSSLLKNLSGIDNVDYIMGCEFNGKIEDIHDVPILFNYFSMSSDIYRNLHNKGLKILFGNASLIILIFDYAEQESMSFLNESVIQFMKHKDILKEHHQVILLGNQRQDMHSMIKGKINYSENSHELADKISSDIGEPVNYFEFDISNSKHVVKFRDWILTGITENMDKPSLIEKNT
jgi:hypothetical protein